MGATGLSVARHLLRAGVAFAVTDSRDAPPKAGQLAALAEVPCHFGAFASPLPLSEISEAVVSPGIAIDEPFLRELRNAGIPIIGDIELFARTVQSPRNNVSSPLEQCSKPQSRTIAITGSNGKSTVTAWVAEVARAAGLNTAVGGNFGPPALDLLAEGVDLYVMELSSFQLELTQTLTTRAATVLNVSIDHIDRHGDIGRYARLKARIFAHAEVAVVNADDERVAAMATGGAKRMCFGAGPDADYRLLNGPRGAHLARGDIPWLACDALALTGRHNQINALAVWALAEATGCDEGAIRTGLRRFAGLPHRCQVVTEIAGVRWINDSKGTNLGALMAALSGLPAPVILLAGGQAKGADFTPLGPLAQAKAKAVIVFGQDGPLIAAAVRAYAAAHAVTTLYEAVAKAAALTTPGDTVLLSPGCASFDQFADYAQRGEAFVAAVQELAA